jgi:hypothetical protein
MEPPPFGCCCGFVLRATWKKHQKFFSAPYRIRAITSQCSGVSDFHQALCKYPIAASGKKKDGTKPAAMNQVIGAE